MSMIFVWQKLTEDSSILNQPAMMAASFGRSLTTFITKRMPCQAEMSLCSRSPSTAADLGIKCAYEYI